jgi:hypothetical protein
LTTVDLVKFFMRRRACPARDAVRLAESVRICRSLKPDRPRGQDRQQLRIPFAELKRR